VTPFEVHGGGRIDDQSVPPITSFLPSKAAFRAFFTIHIRWIVAINIPFFLLETSVVSEHFEYGTSSMRSVRSNTYAMVALMMLQTANAIFFHRCLPELQRQVDAIDQATEDTANSADDARTNDHSNAHAKVSRKLDAFFCQGQRLPKVTLFINLACMLFVFSGAMLATVTTNFAIATMFPSELRSALRIDDMHSSYGEWDEDKARNEPAAVVANFKGLPDGLQEWANRHLVEPNLPGPFRITMADGNALYSMKDIARLDNGDGSYYYQNEDADRYLFQEGPEPNFIHIHKEYINPQAAVAFVGETKKKIQGHEPSSDSREDETTAQQERSHVTSACFVHEERAGTSDGTSKGRRFHHRHGFHTFVPGPIQVRMTCYFAAGIEANLLPSTHAQQNENNNAGYFHNSTTAFDIRSLHVSHSDVSKLPLISKFHQGQMWLLHLGIPWDCERQRSCGSSVNASVFVSDHPNINLEYKGSTIIDTSFPSEIRIGGRHIYGFDLERKSGGSQWISWVLLVPGIAVSAWGGLWIFKSTEAKAAALVPIGCALTTLLGAMLQEDVDGSEWAFPLYLLLWLAHLFLYNIKHPYLDRDMMLWTSYGVLSVEYPTCFDELMIVFAIMICIQGLVLDHMTQVGIAMGVMCMLLAASGILCALTDEDFILIFFFAGVAFFVYAIVGAWAKKYRPYVTVYVSRWTRRMRQTVAALIEPPSQTNSPQGETHQQGREQASLLDNAAGRGV